MNRVSFSMNGAAVLEIHIDRSERYLQSVGYDEGRSKTIIREFLKCPIEYSDLWGEDDLLPLISAGNLGAMDKDFSNPLLECAVSWEGCEIVRICHPHHLVGFRGNGLRLAAIPAVFYLDNNPEHYNISDRGAEAKTTRKVVNCQLSARGDKIVEEGTTYKPSGLLDVFSWKPGVYSTTRKIFTRGSVVDMAIMNVLSHVQSSIRMVEYQTLAQLEMYVSDILHSLVDHLQELRKIMQKDDHTLVCSESTEGHVSEISLGETGKLLLPFYEQMRERFESNSSGALIPVDPSATKLSIDGADALVCTVLKYLGVIDHVCGASREWFDLLTMMTTDRVRSDEMIYDRIVKSVQQESESSEDGEEFFSRFYKDVRGSRHEAAVLGAVDRVFGCDKMMELAVLPGEATNVLPTTHLGGTLYSEDPLPEETMLVDNVIVTRADSTTETLTAARRGPFKAVYPDGEEGIYINRGTEIVYKRTKGVGVKRKALKELVGSCTGFTLPVVSGGFTRNADKSTPNDESTTQEILEHLLSGELGHPGAYWALLHVIYSGIEISSDSACYTHLGNVVSTGGVKISEMLRPETVARLPMSVVGDKLYLGYVSGRYRFRITKINDKRLHIEREETTDLGYKCKVMVATSLGGERVCYEECN